MPFTKFVSENRKRKDMKTTTFKTMLVWSVFLILIAGSAKSTTIDVDKKGIITGRISDFTTNKPIEFITVDLYDTKDSALIAGTLTDLEGQFSILMLDTGSYYLEINQQNFQKKVIHPLIIDENNSKVNLGEILLYQIPRKSTVLYSRRKKSEKRIASQLILAEKK